MREKSRTLKRLGVAGLGAAIALGTPSLGFVGSALAADNPAVIQWLAPATGTASTLNDGTNSTVKLSVIETELNTGAGNPDLTAVQFSYKETANAGGPISNPSPVVIDVDNSAPYSIEWAPPENGTYDLIAAPLAAGGGSAGTPVTQSDVQVSSTAPSVHITSPSDGDVVPFLNTDGHNVIGVKGTRSNGAGGLPAISVQTGLYDETSGLLLGVVANDDVVEADATPGANPDRTWLADVDIPTAECPASHKCELAIRAVAGATVDQTGVGDEAVLGSRAANSQTLAAPATFTVTPTGPQSIHTTQSKTYTVTALDANGAPIAGLRVTATPDANSDATVTPPARVTDANGEAKFTVTDETAETTTLTFQSNINGESFDEANDFTVTRSLTTTAFTPVITSIQLSKTPNDPTYAVQSYSSDYPTVNACVQDQEGSPFHNADSTLLVDDTRTLNGVVSHPDGDVGSEESSGNPATPNGCYQVTLEGYPNAGVGSDTITVYKEVNGTPGFQSGDIGDTITVNFAHGRIFFDHYFDCTPGNTCATQAQTGTVDTITVGSAAGLDPVAGQKLNLALSGGTAETFPVTQPTGTTRTSNNSATCVTVTDGTCKVNVSDSAGNTDDDVVLTATTLQGLSGSITISFRNNSVALHGVVREDNETLYPSGSNGNADTTVEDYGAPGTILVDTYQLRDSSGQELADVPVTIDADHGFFTDVPNGNDYNTGTFTPTPAAGGTVGTPKNNGATLHAFTDNNGEITFAMSIGRDAGFDDNGEVLTTLTWSSNGVTAAVGNGNPAGDSVADQDYTWTTNTLDLVGFGNCNDARQTSGVRPAVNCDTLGDVIRGGALNGASVKISPVPGFSLTGNHTSGYNHSHNATRFYVQAKDQFGNLVGTDTSVSGTGAGNGTTCDSVFSAYNTEVANNSEEACAVNSTGGTPTTASPFTVTDTWLTQTTEWTANNDQTAGEPAFVADVTADVSSPTKTDSFTINLYSVDINNLTYKYKVLPANIVKTGTTVHDEVIVTDQYHNPAQGLFVAYQQSGPGSVDDTSYATTNGAGTASDNFSSSVQGDATVTIDVYQCDVVNDPNCSNLPLSESVNTVSFDAVPTIAVLPTHRKHAGHVKVAGVTRPGASVVLLEKSGSGGFAKVGSAQTADNDGGYSFTVHVSQTSSFKVVVDDIQTSATRTVTVGKGKITEKPTLKLSSKNKGELKATAKTHPKLEGEKVNFYKVKKNGHRSKLGSDTTNNKGKAKQTFELKPGKKYTLVAKVVHLGKGYKSKFSKEQTKRVKA